MRTVPYTFDFDVDVSRAEAIRVIVAALEEDGLQLTESDNTPGSDINTVIVGGFKRVIVPAHRVRRKGLHLVR